MSNHRCNFSKLLIWARLAKIVLGDKTNPNRLSISNHLRLIHEWACQTPSTESLRNPSAAARWCTAQSATSKATMKSTHKYIMPFLPLLSLNTLRNYKAKACKTWAHRTTQTSCLLTFWRVYSYMYSSLIHQDITKREIICIRTCSLSAKSTINTFCNKMETPLNTTKVNNQMSTITRLNLTTAKCLYKLLI